jgi:hypothetical protein
VVPDDVKSPTLERRKHWQPSERTIQLKADRTAAFAAYTVGRNDRSLTRKQRRRYRTIPRSYLNGNRRYVSEAAMEMAEAVRTAAERAAAA